MKSCITCLEMLSGIQFSHRMKRLCCAVRAAFHSSGMGGALQPLDWKLGAGTQMNFTVWITELLSISQAYKSSSPQLHWKQERDAVRQKDTDRRLKSITEKNHTQTHTHTHTHGWMNDDLYCALLCIAVHPKHFTIMWGVSPQPPPVVCVYVYIYIYIYILVVGRYRR